MIRIVFKDEVIRKFRIIHISSEGVETEIDSAVSVKIPEVGIGHSPVATVEFLGAEVIEG